MLSFDDQMFEGENKMLEKRLEEKPDNELKCL